jgi:hypothetical protein
MDEGFFVYRRLRQTLLSGSAVMLEETPLLTGIVVGLDPWRFVYGERRRGELACRLLLPSSPPPSDVDQRAPLGGIATRRCWFVMNLKIK